MKQFLVRSLGLILFFSIAGLFQNTLSAQRTGTRTASMITKEFISDNTATAAVIDIKSGDIYFEFYAGNDAGEWNLIESGVVRQPTDANSTVDKKLVKPAKAVNMRLKLRTNCDSCATADFQ